jgi:hypothetical protein
MRGILQRVLRRRGVRLTLTALVVTPLAVLAVAAPAYAATCVPSYTAGAHGPVAGVDFTFAPECSDGLANLSGRVYDESCDSRTAYVQFELYDRTSSGTYALWYRSPWYKDSAGCGSSATFGPWRPTGPGTVGWKLTAILHACSNSSGCSSDYKASWFG